VSTDRVRVFVGVMSQKIGLYSACVAILVGVPLAVVSFRGEPAGIAPMQVSPCTTIICEEDEEPFCWCDVKVTVTVTANPIVNGHTVIAVSCASEEESAEEEDSEEKEEPNKKKRYNTDVTVKVAVDGELRYDENFYEFVTIEWHLGGLNGLQSDTKSLEEARFNIETRQNANGEDVEEKKEK